MKKPCIILLFIVPLLFSSCATIFVPRMLTSNMLSNEEVLNGYINKSKSEVIRDFGAPSNEQMFEGIEFWYYNKGIVTEKNNAGVIAFPESTIGLGIGSSSSNSTTKYVEFQFENELVSSVVWNGDIYGHTKVKKRRKLVYGVLSFILIDATVMQLIALAIAN